MNFNYCCSRPPLLLCEYLIYIPLYFAINSIQFIDVSKLYNVYLIEWPIISHAAHFTILNKNLVDGYDFSLFVLEMSFPRFAEPIPNVTVTVGRDALLACVVDNLRGFKVSRVGWWIARRGLLDRPHPEIEFLCLFDYAWYRGHRFALKDSMRNIRGKTNSKIV